MDKDGDLQNGARV
jgi:hypothetical protein